MSNIRNLLVPCNLDDVFQHSRNVILTHLFPVERPIFGLVFIMVILSVTQTVSVATRVTQPHIVAATGSYERRRDGIVVHNPCVA